MQKYNKAIWGGVAAAATTILSAILKGAFDIEIDGETQGAITTFFTVLVVYFVPNVDIEKE